MQIINIYIFYYLSENGLAFANGLLVLISYIPIDNNKHVICKVNPKVSQRDIHDVHNDLIGKK